MNLYYQDIASVLVDETSNCQFESFALRRFAAYSDPIGDQSLILIDEQWPMFFWDANLLVCLRTFEVLNERECEETERLFYDNCQSFRNPYQSEVIKDQLRPYMLKYKPILPLVNLLTKCMFGFVICHEIAHTIHGHSFKPQTPEMEMEADATGFELLLKVCGRFESLKNFTVPPNMVCAPIMASNYLDVVEELDFLTFDPTKYPTSKQRAIGLQTKFHHTASDNALYLFDGLLKGFSDLQNP